MLLLSGLFSASSTTEFTIREIVRCLRLAQNGIDAVLLVFSVRNRLTEEEQSTLRTLKILFGSQIVDYMIVVFTNGDAFDEGDTLDDYLEDCPEFQVVFFIVSKTVLMQQHLLHGYIIITSKKTCFFNRKFSRNVMIVRCCLTIDVTSLNPRKKNKSKNFSTSSNKSQGRTMGNLIWLT